MTHVTYPSAAQARPAGRHPDGSTPQDGEGQGVGQRRDHKATRKPSVHSTIPTPLELLNCPLRTNLEPHSQSASPPESPHSRRPNATTPDARS